MSASSRLKIAVNPERLRRGLGGADPMLAAFVEGDDGDGARFVDERSSGGVPITTETRAAVLVLQALRERRRRGFVRDLVIVTGVGQGARVSRR